MLANPPVAGNLAGDALVCRWLAAANHSGAPIISGRAGLHRAQACVSAIQGSGPPLGLGRPRRLCRLQFGGIHGV